MKQKINLNAIRMGFGSPKHLEMKNSLKQHFDWLRKSTALSFFNDKFYSIYRTSLMTYPNLINNLCKITTNQYIHNKKVHQSTRIEEENRTWSENSKPQIFNLYQTNLQYTQQLQYIFVH